MMIGRLCRLSLLALVAIMGWPSATTAQDARRWLADPELITLVRTIGPNGSGAQTRNTIVDMDLLDSRTGWAAAYTGLLKFDGRFWRPETTFGGSGVGVRAIDMTSATDGWTGGSSFIAGAPGGVFLARYNGTSWTPQNDFVRRDGTSGFLYGSIADIAARPDGTAWAIGSAWEPKPGTEGGYDERPLALFFDGSRWRDQTPAVWRFGQLTSLALLGGGEAWATGRLGRPGGSGDEAARPAIVRFQNGAWTEARLPALPISSQPFNLHGLTMRDASEGWAIFFDAGAECSSGRLLHYTGGAWTLTPGEAHGFSAITALGLVPGTNRGWASLAGCSARGQNVPARRMRFDNGVFTPDTTGARLVPDRYALLDEQTQWAAAGGAAMRFRAESLPTDRITTGPAGSRFFDTTGHSLAGPFRAYYESHGLNLGEPGVSDRESLALFGYPLSEPFTEINPDTGELLQSQYFERARMEYHPNNPDPYKVLLGRFGFQALLKRNQVYEPRPEGPTPAGCARYNQTGYDLCAPFRGYWEGNGGLPVFGYPINQTREQISETDGKRYLTQWFERERLEHHPELSGTPYEVLLGLLAVEELRARGYIP